MRAVAQQTLLGAGLLVLTLFTRSTGSNVPYVIPSQSQLPAQRSGAIDADESRWFAQLNSSDTEKRREAVMELSHVEGSAATSALLSALADRSSRVRAAAAAGIARRLEAPAVPALAACLTKDKDAFVRKMAAYALGGFRGIDRTAALIAALKDKDAEVRGAAAVSLGVFPDADAVAALTAALSDKNAFVRAQAARALGVNGSAATQAVPQLSKLLASDEDGEVRRQAAIALGLIGDRSALTSLELARHDKDPYLVLAAIESIKILSRR
jgi:HEAT repeat protein